MYDNTNETHLNFVIMAVFKQVHFRRDIVYSVCEGFVNLVTADEPMGLRHTNNPVRIV